MTICSPAEVRSTSDMSRPWCYPPTRSSTASSPRRHCPTSARKTAIPVEPEIHRGCRHLDRSQTGHLRRRQPVEEGQMRPQEIALRRKVPATKAVEPDETLVVQFGREDVGCFHTVSDRQTELRLFPVVTFSASLIWDDQSFERMKAPRPFAGPAEALRNPASIHRWLLG
jgi:hypothetical protein